MSISPDEFKRGETKNSREEIVYQFLGDGMAHSRTELENEVGIIRPKTNDPINTTTNTIIYLLDKQLFMLELDRMERDGRIVSKQINDKDGSVNIYYMRKEFLK